MEQPAADAAGRERHAGRCVEGGAENERGRAHRCVPQRAQVPLGFPTPLAWLALERRVEPHKGVPLEEYVTDVLADVELGEVAAGERLLDARPAPPHSPLARHLYTGHLFRS